MYLHTRRALIINFNGIGNGIWILPMLKCLDYVAPNCSYFHIHNPVFDSREFMDWMGLENFLGTVPTAWRRFEPRDWESIKEFLTRNSIDLLINLRNEGPFRDVGYFKFKTEMSQSNVEFWELDHSTIARRYRRQHLLLDQLNLLKSHGVDLMSFDRRWLKHYVADRSHSQTAVGRIGLFTGASQEVKTWPAEQWITLGRMLLKQTDFNLTVYSGQVERELILAQTVAEQLRNDFPTRCSLVQHQSLESLSAHLSSTDLIVSNDTSCIHIAAALDVPTVGLYFSTDSAIWGGMNEKFVAVQSQTGLDCPSFKLDAGNCNFYYGGCPGPCKDEVTPELVYLTIERHLNGWIRVADLSAKMIA
ncbi:MAG TPA: glycosyltransferase family 9 protein [Pyrinomonadaceae bacterium]